MKKLKIFEPAMCCSTGLCGVGVDPELLRISTVVSALGKNGVTVERYNLSNDPIEFVNNTVINKLINEEGVDGLPASVLDDELVISGRYPTNDEIIKLLEIPSEYLDAEKPGECCSDCNCC